MSRRGRPSNASRQTAIESARVAPVISAETIASENASAIAIAAVNPGTEIKVAPSDNLQRNDVVPFAFRTCFFNPN